MNQVENFRPTMHIDVLKSWAQDAQIELETLRAENAKMKQSLMALVSDISEYHYRVSSQVPFEQAEWANKKSAAILEALQSIIKLQDAN